MTLYARQPRARTSATHPVMFNASRLFANILCIAFILCLTHLLVRNAPMLEMEVQTAVLAMHLPHVPFVTGIALSDVRFTPDDR